MFRNSVKIRSAFDTVISYSAMAAVAAALICTSACGGVTGGGGTSSGTADAPTLAPVTLAVSPTSLSFGNVVIGNSSKQNVTVTNAGTVPIVISAVNFQGSPFSSSGLVLPFTMNGGASGTVAITFAPDTSGPVTGSVTVVSTAG